MPHFLAQGGGRRFTFKFIQLAGDLLATLHLLLQKQRLVAYIRPCVLHRHSVLPSPLPCDFLSSFRARTHKSLSLIL
ncbi:hypothetical protein I656_02964 [Geobacillus sp. WSUCF1]|nr:hypothetical protein I656_02964 [Geobacillus sp. WSUCF1]